MKPDSFVSLRLISNLLRSAEKFLDRKKILRAINVVACLVVLLLIGVRPVCAKDSIYGLELSDAVDRDLFSFFRFKLVALSVTSDGYTQLVFKPPKSTPFRSFVDVQLVLDEAGKIRRMTMILSRRFITDDRLGMFARDVAKSFVQAAVPNEDFESVKFLVNEIFFRQKLTEVKVRSVVSESSRGDKEASGPTTVYKLGSGKLVPGDIIIMGDASKLPPLPPNPSQMYQCFAGDVDSAETQLTSTVLRMVNKESDGQSVLVLSLNPKEDDKAVVNEGVDFRSVPLHVPR